MLENNITAESISNWYRAVDPNPSTELLNSRIEGLKQVLKTKKIEFWLDLVRLYIGVPVVDSANIEKLLEKFKKGEETIEYQNNQNLTRCLSSIALCQKLSNIDPKNNSAIALAILNSNFFGQYDPYVAVPVHDFAKNCLVSSSVFDREVKFEEIEESLDELKELTDDIPSIKKGIQSVANDIHAVIQANRALAEESDILWWVFSGYSAMMKTAFKSLNPSQSIVIAAKELAKKTSYYSCLPSAPQILKKIVNSSIPELSLFDVVNSLNTAINEELKENLENSTINFTPCLNAIKKSIESNSGEDWTVGYKQDSLNCDVKMLFSINDIAVQLYREFMYLENLDQ